MILAHSAGNIVQDTTLNQSKKTKNNIHNPFLCDGGASTVDNFFYLLDGVLVELLELALPKRRSMSTEGEDFIGVRQRKMKINCQHSICPPK